MPNPALLRLVRSALENAPDALPLADLLALVDELVTECKASPDPATQIYQFDEDLQAIHHEVYASLHQTETFLAVLSRLSDVLPSTSVMSWFDLVLRPALREPKLPTQAVNHAKCLIVSTLQKTNDAYAEKVGDFRRRLLELYLLDAFNEGSGDDVLEWAELTEEDRQRRTQWKHNLEDILVSFGNERPEEFLDEIDRHFATAAWRLQLVALLNVFSCAPNFASATEILPKLPLMKSLLYSLFLDNSSTLCTLSLTFLIKLLPFFAVHARQDLKDMLPRLLAILARIMCWKERRASKVMAGEDFDPAYARELERETNPVLKISPDINWERLDMSFDATASLPPSSRPYFTILYYLYPSNVLKFLREPVRYLGDAEIPSPYVESWEEAFDLNEIHRRSENLAREHNCHPLLVRRDGIIELSEPEFWTKYTITRIVSEAHMLDLRNLIVALQARYLQHTKPPATQNMADQDEPSPEDIHSPQFMRPIDLTSGKAVISLQDMINTTIALKSNLDVEVIQPSSQWPHSLFSTNSIPSSENNSPPALASLQEDENTTHVAQAISGLQREVLLLRNDLNFELWLSRENSERIGSLYQDRIVMRTAEAERQGLYNKLRNYRSQVIRLESELREHKQQASSAKNKYADWNTELQKKLKELREEKKSWVSETAALRTAEKETKAHFVAQGKLLADATQEVFRLQTQKKENQHKVDRLHDYERQIEQYIKVQRLWDEDFAKFNAREQEIQDMKTQYKQMQLRLESMERAGEGMEENARGYRRQIQALEAKLNHIRHRPESPRVTFAQELATFSEEKANMKAANETLRDENMELREEVEELKAMVELLKSQHTGRRGLVSERSSPILTSFVL
ncbi:unnamed protein product [Cyclocybe aegerita]|uniref:Hamartin n=1 Tax=Cyclocybe aegerita TaxID=1973307 RepID=A0A8S0X2S5_CYCAE|nr:unnamed protein product [Cyclocybe aegerita]